MRPDQLVPHLLSGDPSRPVITAYDDATDERVELSARVISMWSAKASHWLSDEMLLEPGGRVRLNLPARHWRSIYWALGVWSLGGQVLTHPSTADVVVTTALPGDIVEPEPALAPSELTGFPDQFDAYVQAASTDQALDDTTYGQLLDPDGGSARIMLTDTDSVETLLRAGRSLAAGGSVVLVRNPDPSRLDARRVAEGIA